MAVVACVTSGSIHYDQWIDDLHTEDYGYPPHLPALALQPLQVFRVEPSGSLKYTILAKPEVRKVLLAIVKWRKVQGEKATYSSIVSKALG